MVEFWPLRRSTTLMVRVGLAEAFSWAIRLAMATGSPQTAYQVPWPVTNKAPWSTMIMLLTVAGSLANWPSKMRELKPGGMLWLPLTMVDSRAHPAAPDGGAA